jgi:hypothetical protein
MTHEEVLAAIDKAHAEYAVWWRRDHCDDLRATAERHAPFTDAIGMENCQYESYITGDYMPWPCPDFQQVIDRLTKWGVL